MATNGGSRKKVSTFTLENVGQISKACVRLGDLTVLVGPQATGKSVFLQLFHLNKDYQFVRNTLKRHGYDWKKDWGQFLDLTLGEGMCGLWSETSKVLCDNKPQDLPANVLGAGKGKNLRHCFYIPAQRVLVMQNGWPRAFTTFQMKDPYVVRNFGEDLRLLMEAGLGSGEEGLFPKDGKLKKGLRHLLQERLYQGGGLKLDTNSPQKRLILEVGGSSLPFMVWSAGQREFTPLLLGLYWLLPSTKQAKPGIDWVVLEEPEMGLHPLGLSVVLLFVFELIGRGYKVLISTHSPQVLEMVWALKEIKKCGGGYQDVLRLFDANGDSSLKSTAETALASDISVSYFAHTSPCRVESKDISELDPGSEAPEEANWGGLAEFGGRAAEIVSEVVNRKKATR